MNLSKERVRELREWVLHLPKRIEGWGRGDDNKALAVLRRAEKVMEAVEKNIYCGNDGFQMMTHAQADAILEAALSYREGKEKP